MKLAKQLFAAVIALAALATQQVQAIDGINVINVSLKAVVEGDSIARGDNVISQFGTLRASTHDLIGSVGLDKGILFGPRAQLLLIRRNFGQDDESSAIIIREPGRADLDINDYFAFTPGNPVQSGTINVNTSRARTTLQYIGTLTINIPGETTMSLSGFTTEKTGTALISGSEVSGNVFSVVGNLAGEGTANDGLSDQLIVVQGTLRVGATKLVPSVL